MSADVVSWWGKAGGSSRLVRACIYIRACICAAGGVIKQDECPVTWEGSDEAVLNCKVNTERTSLVRFSSDNYLFILLV